TSWMRLVARFFWHCILTSNKNANMKLLSAIGGGVAGAAVLTVLHETVRRFNTDAPRMDKLGMEAISNTLEKANIDLPGEKQLFEITMAADMISNSSYY